MVQYHLSFATFSSGTSSQTTRVKVYPLVSEVIEESWHFPVRQANSEEFHILVGKRSESSLGRIIAKEKRHGSEKETEQEKPKILEKRANRERVFSIRGLGKSSSTKSYQISLYQFSTTKSIRQDQPIIHSQRSTRPHPICRDLITHSGSIRARNFGRIHPAVHGKFLGVIVWPQSHFSNWKLLLKSSVKNTPGSQGSIQ